MTNRSRRLAPLRLIASPTAHSFPFFAAVSSSRLLHSDQPVTCIGREVGWPDQNYFARRFKAHYGLSATTYRTRFAQGAARLQAKQMAAG